MSENTTEIRFVVWQFVRLMVQLEESVKAGTDKATKELYNSWEDIWVDLDAKLIDMGKKNPESFAELMMDQEVVSELTNDEADLVALQLKIVLDDITNKLKHTDVEEDVEDLSFERDELSQLINELKAIHNK